MPNKCSIINCGATLRRNRPNLTFHRLPQNKHKKRIWLEVIGKANIRSDFKNIYICSLHFHKSSFNRTLDVIRLKDDAVPSLLLQQPLYQATLTARDDNVDAASQQNLELQPLHQAALTARDDNVDAVSQQNIELQPLHQVALTSRDDNVDAASQQNLELDHALKELNRLHEKVYNQQKKIKRLNETIRRQKIKMATFKEVIMELKEKNLMTHENCILLEQGQET